MEAYGRIPKPSPEDRLRRKRTQMLEQQKNQATSLRYQRDKDAEQLAKQRMQKQQQMQKQATDLERIRKPGKPPKSAGAVTDGLVNRQKGSPRYGQKYRAEARPVGALHIYEDGTRILVRKKRSIAKTSPTRTY